MGSAQGIESRSTTHELMYAHLSLPHAISRLSSCRLSDVEHVRKLARQWKRRQRERDGDDICLEAARVQAV